MAPVEFAGVLAVEWPSAPFPPLRAPPSGYSRCIASRYESCKTILAMQGETEVVILDVIAAKGGANPSITEIAPIGWRGLLGQSGDGPGAGSLFRRNSASRLQEPRTPTTSHTPDVSKGGKINPAKIVSYR